MIDTVEELHESRPAALEAARRLLAENARRFDRNVAVEAEVISELEWSLMQADRSQNETIGLD